MRIAWVFLLLATSNWVLADESPHLNDLGDSSSTAPPTGEGDNSDLILALVFQLTKDMSDVKDDLGEVKVNQAVLQQDVSSLQQTSGVTLAKVSRLETQFEGND